MTNVPKINELSAGSICITTQRRAVRIDDAQEETEHCYLTIEGSPDGFRWLAQHFDALANSSEKHGGSAGNIVAPWDFKNEPIKLEGWDSIDFHCQK